MFKKIRKRLTWLFAASFLFFLLLFLFVLYFALTNLMEKLQFDELETYYWQQRHDLEEHQENLREEKDDDEDQENKDKKELITYDPNRMYFYYIYDSKHTLVHGDEAYEGLYNVMGSVFSKESAEKSSVHKLVWKDEHFLLLKKPIFLPNDVEGYIVLGKSVTTQYHFFKNVLFVLVGLTAVFTLVIAWLSYYLSGKAMVPIREAFEKQKKFVSDASHELRTPLSIFYSSVELIESDPDNQLSSFSEELIDDLKDESKLMEDLLTELLFLARHDQKQVSLKMEDIHLSGLLSKIGEKFARTLEDSKVVLQLDIAENVHFTGDAMRVEELVYILLDNAAQYTKEGSIHLGLQASNAGVKIVVEDTGSGILAEELPLIFDRFYRGDVARKRTGTGLGLAIAKTIVEQHHGKIEVESEQGKGTKFMVELPIRK